MKRQQRRGRRHPAAADHRRRPGKEVLPRRYLRKPFVSRNEGAYCFNCFVYLSVFLLRQCYATARHLVPLPRALAHGLLLSHVAGVSWPLSKLLRPRNHSSAFHPKSSLSCVVYCVRSRPGIESKDAGQFTCFIKPFCSV